MHIHRLESRDMVTGNPLKCTFTISSLEFGSEQKLTGSWVPPLRLHTQEWYSPICPRFSFMSPKGPFKSSLPNPKATTQNNSRGWFERNFITDYSACQFGSLKGGSKSVQVPLNRTEAVVLLTLPGPAL